MMNKRILVIAVPLAVAAAGALTVALWPAIPSASIATEHTIQMKFDADSGKVYFEPQQLAIKSGDRVTWVQVDPDNEHNVVSYPDGIPKDAKPFESRMMRTRGEQWSKVFTEPGTYKYHCHPHETVGMTAMIVVDRESRPDEMRQAKPGEHMHGTGMQGGHDGAGGSAHRDKS